MAAKPKILVVDDNESIRSIVVNAFSRHDCEVFEAGNGTEGLTLAGREKPDILLLDIVMPVMNGVEMLSRVKTNPELKHLPVLFLTGHATRENVAKIACMGVRDFLLKPFTGEHLLEQISRIMNLTKKGEAPPQIKRFDDPLKILLADDKPAIHEQIQSGLADTSWTVEACGQAQDALESCAGTIPDAILASLSLPGDAAFRLLQSLRTEDRTRHLPVFGLCVKTALEEQKRALQAGFTGVITKPIDPEDLKTKISRALNLDTSYQYFEQRDGVLVLQVPHRLDPDVTDEIMKHLQTKVAEAVDAGLDKMVIDLSELKQADSNLVKLGVNAIQLARELDLKQRIIGSETVRQACKDFEETHDWQFVNSFAEALEAFKVPAAAEA